MFSIEELNHKNVDLCFELDLSTISLWSKKQWDEEFKKPGIKVLGLFLFTQIVGICVHQVVLDEVQINYFSIKKKFRRSGYGTSLISHLIKHCEDSGIRRLFLEVSEKNTVAQKFYKKFNFATVGFRKNYYKDGSSALLKEKKLLNKF